ncbi:MAG: hypothetical protein AAF411_26720 [Myxococcota bacterium]
MTRTNTHKILDTAAQGLALYAALLLWPFAFGKLAGDPSALQGMRQIALHFGADPTLLRYALGIQEALVILGLAAGSFAFVGPRFSRLQRVARLGAVLGGLGLGLTMGGALATEFIVRPGEQAWLVDLALKLMVFGTVVAAWAVHRFRPQREVASAVERTTLRPLAAR